MTQREILELRWNIETDPILTDEEIEFILNAIERQHPVKVLIDEDIFRCSDCGRCVAKLDEYCWLCGQKLDWVEIKMSQEEAYHLIELCLEYDKDMSDYPERYDMALCIAREVFQKQVPVKPVYDHRYADMGCAFCGNSVGGLEELSLCGLEESPDYCPQCGQAIDWRIE